MSGVDGHNKPGPHQGSHQGPGVHQQGPGSYQQHAPSSLRDRLLGRRTVGGPGQRTDHLGQTILEHEDNLSDKEVYPGHQQQPPHTTIPAIGESNIIHTHTCIRTHTYICTHKHFDAGTQIQVFASCHTHTQRCQKNVHGVSGRVESGHWCTGTCAHLSGYHEGTFSFILHNLSSIRELTYLLCLDVLVSCNPQAAS